jgi:auxin responsive GH3 family protein
MTMTMTIQGGAAAMGGAESNLHRQVEEQAADHDIIDWFEGIAENAGPVQTQTLKRILEINRDTVYLRKWLGNDLKVQDLEPEVVEAMYTSLVPLASHADLEPYIQRIADGDDSPLLTAEPITMLSLR